MYMLDANAFIEASRLYYAADIAPGFWTWLADPARANRVTSIDAVKDELTSGTGYLVGWANGLPRSFWRTETADVVAAMTELATWATDPARQYRQEAIVEFLDSADYKLIAHAMATGATVATREQPAPAARKKVKIPDVCNAFNVAWTDPFSLYRTLGMRLTA